MWLEQSDGPLARTLALRALAPAAWAFGAGTLLRSFLYERGVLRGRRLPIRVVSVGKLAAAEAGESLTAAWIASALHRRGHRVALAGCAKDRPRRLRDAALVVSDGSHLKSRAEIVGAAAMILAARAPGVPVLVGGNRFRVGLRAASAFGADILVLDDGFQEHSLLRDVDVVALDGQFGFGNARLLPRGPLREPVKGLRRADAVVVIDGPLEEGCAKRLDRAGAGIRRFSARRKPIALRPLRGGASESPAMLDGAAVGLISGRARPTALRHSVEQLGARVVTERNFRDHRRYGPRDMQYLYRNAPLWIVTETDALRINPDWIGRADVRALSVRLEIEQEAALLDWLEASLA